MIRWVILIMCSLGLTWDPTLPRAMAQDAALQARADQLEQQALQERGRHLYRQACAVCHGMRGNGQGPAAPGLEPKPHDFTKGVYKFRTTPIDAMPTDSDLVRTIREGIPGTAMPAWQRLLSPSQHLALAQYLKTFAAEKFAAAPPPSPLVLPPAPAATAERIGHGQALYERLQCWQCHGHGGRGDGPIASNLRDAWNHPIRPRNFTHGIYKSGSQPEDLLRTILTGLAGTPMPPWSSTVSVEEGWDLVHYIRSLSRAGTFWHALFTDTGEAYPGR